MMATPATTFTGNHHHHHYNPAAAVPDPSVSSSLDALSRMMVTSTSAMTGLSASSTPPPIVVVSEPTHDNAEHDRSHRPKSKKRKNKRSGKWTDEEERYARCLIQSYAAGLFELPRGQTLRFFIATKLRCSPMRVTKKFPGTGSVMKQSAVASSSSLSSSCIINHVADAHQLAKDFMGSQEQAFLASIKKHVGGNSGASNNVTSISAESMVRQISNSSSAYYQSGHNISKKKKKATSTKQQQHGQSHPHRISPTASAEELPVTTVSSLQLPTASTSFLFPTATATTQSLPAMLLSHWNNIAGLVNHNNNNMGAAATTPPAAPLQTGYDINGMNALFSNMAAALGPMTDNNNNNTQHQLQAMIQNVILQLQAKQVEDQQQPEQEQRCWQQQQQHQEAMAGILLQQLLLLGAGGGVVDHGNHHQQQQHHPVPPPLPIVNTTTTTTTTAITAAAPTLPQVVVDNDGIGHNDRPAVAVEEGAADFINFLTCVQQDQK